MNGDKLVDSQRALCGVGVGGCSVTGTVPLLQSGRVNRAGRKGKDESSKSKIPTDTQCTQAPSQWEAALCAKAFRKPEAAPETAVAVPRQCWR